MRFRYLGRAVECLTDHVHELPTLIGLVWYPSNPAARIFFAVLRHADAVTRHRDRAGRRIRPQLTEGGIAVHPGSWMSIRMSAGPRSFASRTPSSPVPASIV